MAEKRMFTQKIIDSDAFLDMPLSAQALYFHLNMRADDDGFVNNPKKITRYVSASDDDLRLLLAKRFIIGFDSGVIVIKHWRMHNTLKSDRYKPTDYQEEFAALEIKGNKSYTERSLPSHDPVPLVEPKWNQSGSKVEPQNRIEKNREDKRSSIYTREARDTEDDGFEPFWAAYPVKSGDIRQAYFEYVGALQGGATAEEIMAAVEWQSKEKDTRYMPSAEKWLRNKGWTEEKPKPREKASGKSKRMMTASDYAQREVKPVDMDALRKVVDQI